MPLRVMGYDYGTYKKQYDDKARGYRENKDGKKGMDVDEVLSGLKRADRLVSVITLVVYYGERPWDGAMSLRGMLKVGKEVAPFVNDYRLLLVEARKNDLELHNMDNVDLFHLLGLFLDHGKPVDETKASAIEYAGEHNVNREVILTAAGVANRVVDGGLLGQEGVSAMCTFFEKLKEEGVLEGRAEEIIDIGLEDGLSQAEILARLQKRLGVTKKEAEEYFEKFAGQMV